MRTLSHALSSAIGLCLLVVAALLSIPAPLVAASNPSTLTNLDGALKVIFAEPLVNNVVTDTELLSIFDSTSENIQTENTTGGRYIEGSHLFQISAGVGARLEGEYIPEADAPVFQNSRAYLKKIQGTVEMTGDTMRRVTSSEGAYLDYLDEALPQLSERVAHDLDRMYIGYGAGVKARIAASGVGAYNAPAAGQWVTTVDRSFGVTGYTEAFLNFLEGERVGFTSSLAAPVALRNAGTGQAAKVEAIDEAAGTITMSGTQALHDALAANDYIANADSAGNSFPTGNPSVEREPMGLLGAIDDGNIVSTYFNIPRATNRLWKSIVVDGSLAPFNGLCSEDLLTYADDLTAVRGGGKVNVIVMSRSAARGYWKSLKSDRTFIDPRSYTGGKGALEIVLSDRTLQLKVSRKLAPQVVFGVQTNVFKRYALGQWEWDDKTGSIWNRVTDGTGRKDAYFATGFMYEQLFNRAPRKSFRIDGLLPVQ